MIFDDGICDDRMWLELGPEPVFKYIPSAAYSTPEVKFFRVDACILCSI